jgi:hypothetical protein
VTHLKSWIPCPGCVWHELVLHFIWMPPKILRIFQKSVNAGSPTPGCFWDDPVLDWSWTLSKNLTVLQFQSTQTLNAGNPTPGCFWDNPVLDLAGRNAAAADLSVICKQADTVCAVAGVAPQPWHLAPRKAPEPKPQVVAKPRSSPAAPPSAR